MIGAWYRRRYCRAHMTAFLRGELSDGARRRVAHYIDTDTACYTEYRQRRDTEHDLRAGFTTPPPTVSFDRLWQAIQQDLTAPPPTLRLSARVRYGVFGAVIAVLMVLPLTATNGYASGDLPHQPAPLVRDSGTSIAHVTPEDTPALATRTALTHAEATPELETAVRVINATPPPEG